MGNFLGDRPTAQQPRAVSSGRWASTDFSQATTAEPNPTGWHHPGAVLEPVPTNGSQRPFGASRVKRLHDLENGLKTSVAAITVSSTRILSSPFVKPRANLLPTTPASQHISENRHGYRVPAVSFAPEVFTGLSGSQILANSVCHPHLFAMDFSAVASPTAKVQRGVVSQTPQAGGTMHPTLR